MSFFGLDFRPMCLNSHLASVLGALGRFHCWHLAPSGTSIFDVSPSALSAQHVGPIGIVLFGSVQHSASEAAHSQLQKKFVEPLCFWHIFGCDFRCAARLSVQFRTCRSPRGAPGDTFCASLGPCEGQGEPYPLRSSRPFSSVFAMSSSVAQE